MKLVVGLGNIGEKYERTRHNAGFVVVTQLADKMLLRASPQADGGQRIGWNESKKFMGSIAVINDIVLLKPTTFMNESGRSVAAVANFYKINPEDIYIVYDDLDIALGQYKIQFDKGPKVHNGLTSVREGLGTNAFWHVRVGVENREVKGNAGVPGVEYSLQNFAPNERAIFAEVVERIVDELQAVVS